MYKRLFIWLMLCCFTLFAFAQQKHKYEYWIDGNLTNKVEGFTSKTNIELKLDMSSLNRGIHTLYMHVQDSLGRWSAPITHNFLVPRVPPQNTIRAYHYWFNNDVEKGVFVNVDKPASSFAIDSNIMTDLKCRTVTPENIVIMKNDNGNYQIGSKNALHIRFQDSNLYWSDIQTDTFSVFVDDPDLTGFIVNPKADANKSGWSVSGSLNIVTSNHYSGTANPYFQLTGNTTSMTQTISGLPAGNYKLSLMTRCQGGASLEVSINGMTTSITNEEWAAHSLIFSTDGNPFEIKLTKSGNGSACIDDLCLSLNDAATMTVQLAESVNTTNYQGMTLALSDGQQTMTQTIETARTYTFNGLSTTNTYQLTLANQYDMAFASKRDIRLNRGANNVVLDSVAAVHDVTVSVLDADGKDVTSQTDITWYGDEGKELVQSSTISGVPERALLRYTVTLDGELADSYQQPSQLYHYVGPDNNQITVQLEKLAMIEGQYLNMLINYQRATTDSRDTEDGYWTGGLSNIDFKLTNTTTGQTLDDVAIRTGTLVIGSGVSAGDQIQLQASSRQGVFVDAETSFVIADEGTTKVNLTLQELGGITANYESTSNPNDAGYLYDASGKLVAHNSYYGHQLTFEHLPAGSYKLITMAKSQLLGNILYLKEIGSAGLQEGKDYVASAVNVKDGVMSQVDISSVPALDETRFYYTSNNAYFYANKTTTVAGNYVTLSAHVEFKSEYQGKVKDIAFIVDIPDGCQIVQNSALIGTKQAAYTVNGNRITIPLTSENYQEKVRFCFIPTTSGNYTLNGFVRFTAEEEICQPLGMAAVSCGSLNILAPAVATNNSFVVNGTAYPYASIEVFDDEVSLGKTTARANGQWFFMVTLNNPENFSIHTLYAIIANANNKVQTESKKTLYNRNGMRVKTVTMINTAHPATSLETCEYKTVFDFDHPEKDIPAYWYWPSYTDFTFLIDFSENDTTKIENVNLHVFTTSGDIITLPAIYDDKQKSFVAAAKFTSESLPKNVSVTFDDNDKYYLDQAAIDSCYHSVNNAFSDYHDKISSADKRYNQVISSLESEDYNQQVWALQQIIDLTNKYNIVADSTISKEQADSIMAKLNKEDDFISSFTSFEPIDYIKTIDPISGDSIIITAKKYSEMNFDKNNLKSFQAIVMDNGSIIYSLVNENHVTYIDVQNDYYWDIEYINGKLCPAFVQKNNIGVKELLDYYIKKVDDYIGIFVILGKQADALIEKFEKLQNEIDLKLNEAIKATDVLFKINDVINNIESDVLYHIMDKKTVVTLEEYFKFADKVDRLTAVSNLLSVISGVMGIYKLPYNIREAGEDMAEWSELIHNIANTNCPKQQDKLNRLIFQAGTEAVIRGEMYVKTIKLSIKTIAAEIASISGNPYIAVPCAALATANEILPTAFKCVDIMAKQQIRNQIPTLRTECFDSDEKETPDNKPIEPYDPSSPDSPYNGENPNLNYDPDHPEDYTYCDPNNPYYNPYGPNGSIGGIHIAQSQWDKEKSRSQLAFFPYPTCKDAAVVMDPSGYVYEAVASNRLEGVTVTAYQKTSESESGDGTLWDATQYSQKNPLLTDQNGFYAWDVPIGWWQVKYEKEGYETLYSDWLPVPPPQLDINVAMKSTTAPEVKKMRGFTSGIKIEMSKFMRPETFVDASITVTRNGQKEIGHIEMLNAEASAKDENSYASKIKFVPNTAFNTTDDVMVTVHKGVESYCGVPMAADHTEKVKIELDMVEIHADSAITIPYQNERVIEVSVLPKDASEGETLHATSSSPLIASLDHESATINADGKATFILHGDLPGGAILTFTLDDADLRAETRVSVVLEQMAAMPKASIRSGEKVSKGTTISLTSTTDGATIYYTLDGSCPCLESSRILYTGPITINETVTIKAIAVKDGLADSDIATFFYVVDDGTGVDVTKLSSCQVERHEGSIVVKNARGATCRIYDTMGQLLVQRSNLHEIEQIALPQHDIVIVTVELPDNGLFIRKVGKEDK